MAAPGDVLGALKEAIATLNHLDDLMINYDDKNTPAVTSTINHYVQTLKHIQDSRKTIQGDILLELLHRMDAENLSPMVYSMEQLEKCVGNVKTLGMRDEMFAELKKTIEEGRKAKDEGGKKGAVGGAASTAMDVDK